MSKKKKKRPNKPQAQMRWEFDPGIPTHDFFEGMPLTDFGNLEEAVEDFIFWLEEDRFLTWEAVACAEQHLPLTVQQEEALGGLVKSDRKK